MAADTYSSILGFLQMQTGNNNNNWGDKANASIFSTFEKAIAGAKNLNVTSTPSVDLTATVPPAGESSAIEHIIFVVGSPSGRVTITVPNIVKTWTFFSDIAQPLLLKTASGSAVNIPRGRAVMVLCDGNNTIYRSDRTQVGNLFFHGGTSVPPDALEADGSTKLIADYPDLYAQYGTTWGGNGTTTFGLPSGKDTGRFLRARTASLAVGTYQANDLKSHTHTNSVSASASASTSLSLSASTNSAGSHNHGGFDGTGGSHNHTYADSTVTPTLSSGPIENGGGGPDLFNQDASRITSDHNGHVHTIGTDGAHVHTVNVSGTGSTTVTPSVSVTINAIGGTETRPEAMVGILCVRI